MLEKVGGLSLEHRTYEHDDCEVLFEQEIRDDKIRGRITILRQDNVPSIGVKQALTSRPIDLNDNEGVLEASHFIFMPSAQILAFEFNQFGPRIGLLFKVLNSIYPNYFQPDDPTWAPANFSYIQRGNALDRLASSSGVKSVEATYVDGRFNADTSAGISGFLGQVQEHSEVKRISIGLKGERRSRMPIFTIPNFLNDFLPHREQSLPVYDKLKVEVFNELGGVEVIDLFKDKIVSSITAPRVGRGKQLDSSDLLDKMTSDIQRRADELEREGR